MGSKNVPGPELLFRTNGGGLQVRKLMSGMNKSIPHNLGLLTEGKGSKSFLRPTRLRIAKGRTLSLNMVKSLNKSGNKKGC